MTKTTITAKNTEHKFLEKIFLGTLDKYLVDSAKERDKQPQRLAIRPSQYYKCMRQTYYFLTGQKGTPEINSVSERILGIGTATHEYLQTKIFMPLSDNEGALIKLLKKEDLPVWGEDGIEWIDEHQAPPMEIKFLDHRYTKQIPISAMIDGAVLYMGKKMIVEFKTINDRAFKERLNEPLQDHLKQGIIYALCTGIREIMFLYIDKNTQEWRNFYYVYSDNELDFAKKQLLSIEDSVLTKTVPPMEKSWLCNYCKYKFLCSESEKHVNKI